MSAQGFEGLSPHELARVEVEAWRGECLDFFGKGQALIGNLLQVARRAGHRMYLYERVQDRTVEAVRLADMMQGKTQAEDASAVLAAWQSLESRCDLLANGVATETLDREGNWYALFDMVAYRSGSAARGRWTVSRAEAESFLQELDHSLTLLSQQLGCMCQELGGGSKPKKAQAL